MLIEDSRFDLVSATFGEHEAFAGFGLVHRYSKLEAKIFAPRAKVSTQAFDNFISTIHTVTPVTPDVLVDLTTGFNSHISDQNAKHGVWTLSSFDALAGLGEAMFGHPWTIARIEKRTKDPSKRHVIASARYDTKFAAARNRAFLREKSIWLLERELARISVTGQIAHQDEAEASANEPQAHNLPRYLLKLTYKLTARVVDVIKKKLGGTPKPFGLSIAQGTPLSFDPAKATEIANPKGHYLADPFFAQRDNETYLFFEDYDYATDLGKLSVGRLDNGDLTIIGDTHAAPPHHSYPFVFNHDGHTYMVPETASKSALEVWRSTNWPLGWERVGIQLEGISCADTSLVKRDETWWLFTNICRDSFGDFCSELHVFQVSGPDLKTMVPHAMNPIVLGSDVARNAGRFFDINGDLYRPSQDNTHGTYGYGLNLMKVEDLTLTSYKETRVRHIKGPDIPGAIGCHHIDWLDDNVIFDIRKA